MANTTNFISSFLKQSLRKFDNIIIKHTFVNMTPGKISNILQNEFIASSASVGPTSVFPRGERMI